MHAGSGLQSIHFLRMRKRIIKNQFARRSYANDAAPARWIASIGSVQFGSVWGWDRVRKCKKERGGNQLFWRLRLATSARAHLSTGRRSKD